MLQDPFLLDRKQATEVYLIRHGDAIPGPDEIIPGGIYDDLPLSKSGRAQAQKVAERLKNVQFDAAYSSPLLRCRQTGTPLLAYLQLTPTLVDGLKEIQSTTSVAIPQLKDGEQSPQDMEELYQALQARQAEIVRIAANQGHWNDIAYKESSKDFRRRVVAAMDDIVHKHIGQRVVVFCHGGVINAYAAEVLGLEKDFFFPTVNTSVTIVRANTDTRVLYVLNDMSHLY
jgi:broad specificity phosphatase PhoE